MTFPNLVHLLGCLALVAAAPARQITPSRVMAVLEGRTTELQALDARLAEVTEGALDATVGLRFRSGHASGVLVSSEGHILTVAHAMTPPGRRVRVVLRDGRQLEGETCGRNESGDFGMVRIVDEDRDWSFCELAPKESLAWGSPCLATGYPGWISKSRGPVLRFGTVGGWSPRWLRTSCTIMPGDSGGPIFDLEGRVIGISSWIERSDRANYAIPVERYRENWERLVADEVWDLNSSPDRNRRAVPRALQAQRLGLFLQEDSRQARVRRVTPNSVAARSGLLPGDLLLRVGDSRVRSSRGIDSLFERHRSSQTLRLVVERQGSEVQLEVNQRAAGGQAALDDDSLRAAAEILAAPVRNSVATLQTRFGDRTRSILGVVVRRDGSVLTKASALGREPRARYSTRPSAPLIPMIVTARDEATDLALLTPAPDAELRTPLDHEPIQWETDFEFTHGALLISGLATNGNSETGVVSALPARVRGSRRAYLGVRMQNAADGGALIQSVEPGTAAERAGLRDEDVIRVFDKTDIDTYYDLQDLLRRARPGQRADMTVLRGSEALQLEAWLGQRPPGLGSSSERHVADTIALSIRRSGFPLAVRHDANVAASECGSPLLDARGRVVGLNIARIDRTGTYALPASEVLRVLESWQLDARPGETSEELPSRD